ncbi:MAG: hypothetical protein LBQ12_12265 [Deltaproteobacteria bacterium]|jgi:hypothetical protein|nr:hypothetical protein [Deltaproteobacteria bacterium]
METNLVYPEDIDYGGPVDRAVKDRALLAFDRARDAALKAAGSPEACRALGDRADLTVFGGPYLITGKLASVVFITSGPGEGGLMPYGFLSMNLSRDGVELKASDLFADPSKSLPILWERAFSFFCSGGRSAAPRFYGGGACSGGAGPPPPAFTAGATLEELGHGALRDSGLVFLLGPQDGWNGDEDFSESREELLEMGAVPWLWE